MKIQEIAIKSVQAGNYNKIIYTEYLKDINNEKNNKYQEKINKLKKGLKNEKEKNSELIEKISNLEKQLNDERNKSKIFEEKKILKEKLKRKSYLYEALMEKCK